MKTKEEIECGFCGNPMQPKDSRCSKCNYPIDAEEQKKWYSDMGKLIS